MSRRPKHPLAGLTQVYDGPSTAALLAEYFEGRGDAYSDPTRRWKTTRVLMAAIEEVLETFEGSMSSRQIYYQLVSRGAVENCEKSSDRVQRLVLSMRRTGDILDERIVDRSRRMIQRASWDSVQELLDGARLQYRRDLWTDQPVVPIVICEKQALEGIFAEAVNEYGVQLWPLRGFNSESFAYDLSQEIDGLLNRDKLVAIHFFGDWDPSGLELEHDVKIKLRRFDVDLDCGDVTWSREGLLREDFARFNLVNVPVKLTDSRTKRYLPFFGDIAAELDALSPDELKRRIRDSIECHIRTQEWHQLKQTEKVEQDSLDLVIGNWDQALKAVGGESP